MRFNTIIKASFICAVLIQLGAASTIIQSAGNSEASVPLGFYAPYNTPTVFAVSWTQTSSYNDVSVFANLFTPGGGAVDYTLTTAVGPNTSFAQDGIVSGSVSTPANPTDVELFTLPTLAAGTYYLVLDSPAANTSWQYNFPYQAAGNYTTAPGVTFLGDQQAQFTSINTSYTPGSTFSTVVLPVEFSVTGTAAPEPRLSAGIGLALVGMAILLRKFRGDCRPAANSRLVR